MVGRSEPTDVLVQIALGTTSARHLVRLAVDELCVGDFLEVQQLTVRVDEIVDDDVVPRRVRCSPLGSPRPDSLT